MNKIEEKFFSLENEKNEDFSILDEFCKKYPEYFKIFPSKLNKGILINDECLFKNLLKFHPNRKIDFKLVKNSFVKSKYISNNNNKIWFFYENKKYKGPYNNYQMDNFYFKNRINENTGISLNKWESFILKDFINSTYPIKKFYYKVNSDKLYNFSKSDIEEDENDDVKLNKKSKFFNKKNKNALSTSFILNDEKDKIEEKENSEIDFDENIKKMVYDICEEDNEDEFYYSRRISRKLN